MGAHGSDACSAGVASAASCSITMDGEYFQVPIASNNHEPSRQRSATFPSSNVINKAAEAAEAIQSAVEIDVEGHEHQRERAWTLPVCDLKPSWVTSGAAGGPATATSDSPPASQKGDGDDDHVDSVDLGAASPEQPPPTRATGSHLDGASSGGAPPVLTRSDRAYFFLQRHLSLWRSVRDVKMTGLALLYFMVCTYITCLSNSTVDRINPNSGTAAASSRTRLIDQGLAGGNYFWVKANLPADLTDWMVRGAALLMVLRAFLCGPRAATIARRALYISGSIYLLRAPTVLMTVLPNPYLECKSVPQPNIFYDAALLFIQERMSCGDVFFSGHSIFFNVAPRMWLSYGTHWLPKLFVVVYAILGLVSLVFSSYHYSIDVFIATILTNGFYTIYHWIVKGKIGQNRWWGRIVLYLDAERALDQELGEDVVGNPYPPGAVAPPHLDEAVAIVDSVAAADGNAPGLSPAPAQEQTPRRMPVMRQIAFPRLPFLRPYGGRQSLTSSQRSLNLTDSHSSHDAST